jgi:HSP20 family protein
MTERASAVQAAPATTAIKVVEPKSLRDRLHKMHEAIEHRAYEIFRGNGETLNHDLDDWFKAEAELLHPVHVNMKEAGNLLTLEAEIPGFEAKDLEISLEPRQLTISGKRESRREEKDKGQIVYSERCSNEILRVIDLPAEVDPASTTATLKNGVLELKMPKATESKRHVHAKTA